MMADHKRDPDPLWALCQKFIEDQSISCPETVYQMDHVIQNAYEFLEQICEIVGYANVCGGERQSATHE